MTREQFYRDQWKNFLPKVGDRIVGTDQRYTEEQLAELVKQTDELLKRRDVTSAYNDAYNILDCLPFAVDRNELYTAYEVWKDDAKKLAVLKMKAMACHFIDAYANLLELSK